jgi:hypothetical protein
MANIAAPPVAYGVGPGIWNDYTPNIPANAASVFGDGDYGGLHELELHLNTLNKAAGGYFFAQQLGPIGGEDQLYDRTAVAGDQQMRAVTEAFLQRFGLSFAIRKNVDMMQSLTQPTMKIAQINRAYQQIAAKLVVFYRAKYRELANMGFSTAEARVAADKYITPMIAGELEMMRLRYPYSFGGGGGGKKKSKGGGKQLKGAMLRQAEPATMRNNAIVMNEMVGR